MNTRRSHMQCRRGGIAMVLVMIAVGMCAVLALTYQSTQAVSVQLADGIRAKSRARLIAESGLSMAVAYVQGDSGWRSEKTEGTWVTNHSFHGGRFSVVAEDGEYVDGVLVGDGDFSDNSMDMVTLTVEGQWGSARHTVRGVVSQPKRVLMVVDDPGALTDEDTARYYLLRGWGWRVHLVNDHATVTEFEEAADAVHLVYYPAHSPLKPALRDRMKWLDLPIVAENPVLVHDLQIAGRDSKTYTGHTIEIPELTQIVIDEAGNASTEVTTHYVTEVFPVGQLRICSASATLTYLDSIGNGTKALANQVGSSRNALAVLESGALRADGWPARARRVALPWGGSDFRIATLNANGQILLKRSLDWAGSGWKGFLPGVAVWDTITLRNIGTIDGYESAAGVYTPANANADATISTNSMADKTIHLEGGTLMGSIFILPNADISRVLCMHAGATMNGGLYNLALPVPIPAPTAPSDISVWMGAVTYSTGTTTISSDRMYSDLKITGDATVRISGDVRIYCDDDFIIQDEARLILDEGASLTMYVRDETIIKGETRVNVDPPSAGNEPEDDDPIVADPTRLRWMLLYNSMSVENKSKICATVQTRHGRLTVKDTAHFYGTFIGRNVTVQDDGSIHADTSSSGTTVTMGGGFDLSTAREAVRWIENP